MMRATFKSGESTHDQARQPLRKLWWQVWTCLLPPLGAPFLSQSLQGRVPCENSQRACTHEKVVWLVSSRHDVVDESRTETVRYSKEPGLSEANPGICLIKHSRRLNRTCF